MSQWYSAFLASHIITAIVTTGIIAYGLHSLFRQKLEAISRAAQALAVSTFLAILTGIGLSLSLTTSSVGQLCRNIGLYLAICGITELIFYRASRSRTIFPAKRVLSILAVTVMVSGVSLFFTLTAARAAAHELSAQTKASLTVTAKPDTVTADESFTIGFTLKDANTAKRLAKKKIIIYYTAVGSSDWVSLGQFKTSKKGRIKIELTSPTSLKFKGKWKPSAADSAKYKTTTSNVVTVTVE